ncbi:uncharacterized protein LOC116304901, partial [Actinia tenebrosa]|uniref:Uncharacterized protein LOC116304901 n=1 Tax=Actinia tenebrosa TaxID=6105 RepID=A0A6P8ITK4_ACTTE
MVYQKLTHMCLRCIQNKRTLAKVVGLTFSWLLMFQLLVLLWLHEEKKDQIPIPRFFTKNLSSNQLAALTTANNEKTKTQNFVVITCKRPSNNTKVSDFRIIDSVSNLPHDTKAKYIVIIPHRTKNSSLGLNILEKKDQRSMMFLAEILTSLEDLDGATCVSKAVLSDMVETYDMFSRELLGLPWSKIFLNSSWCNFARRNWSIQIRNRGSFKVLNYISSDNFRGIFQLCNIINGPVVLRKDKFFEIG